MEVIRLHATCVAINDKGVLFTGESGAGKSDLALRLIDRGAALVADDQVEITRDGVSLVASAPESIKGLLEVRGLGIFILPVKDKVIISLVVSLEMPTHIERLPAPQQYLCNGIKIPLIHLTSFELSSPIKVEMALNALKNNSIKVGALRE